MLTEESRVGGEIEPIDIEECEYTAWDSSGHRLELFLENDIPRVRKSSLETELDELLEAINTSAQLNSKTAFQPPEDIKDPADLYECAETHMRASFPSPARWLNKLFSRSNRTND